MITFPTLKLSDLVQKTVKTPEDAQVIYEKLRELRSFDKVFGESLKTMDFDEKILLCQGAKYEHLSSQRFVFRRGDPHNHKLYIIVSGQACVVLPDEEKDAKALKGRNAAKYRFRKALNTLKILQPLNKANGEEGASHNGKRLLKHSPSLLVRSKSIDGFPSFRIALSNQELASEEPVNVDNGVLEKDAVVKRISNVDPEFEKFASTFGRVAHYLDEGECFGDFGFLDNTPKAYSVLCKTDCEFIVFTKEQAHTLLVKKEEEKWDFFKTVFPHLEEIFISSHNLKAFIHSFVTEVYNKGSYIINEGKPPSQTAKFYIIYKGECMLEKNINPKKSVNIAKIGTLTIFGEEILINGEDYDYSVKAVSEIVIVQTIRKELFESSPLFKEFRHYVARMYPKKKQQRDLILENLRKEHVIFPEFTKKDSMIMNNISGNMNHLMTKSTIQNMNNFLIREKSFSGKLSLANSNGSQTEISLSPKKRQSEDKDLIIESTRSPTNSTRFPIRVSMDDSESPKRSLQLQSKLDFITKMPEVEKIADRPLKINDIQKLKLFPEKDPKKLRQNRLLVERLSGTRSSITQPTSPLRFPQTPQSAINRGQVGSPRIERTPTNQNITYNVSKSKIQNSGTASERDESPHLPKNTLFKPQTSFGIMSNEQSPTHSGSPLHRGFSQRVLPNSGNTTPIPQSRIFFKPESHLQTDSLSPKKKKSESIDMSMQSPFLPSPSKTKASTMDLVQDVSLRKDYGSQASIHLESSREVFNMKTMQVAEQPSSEDKKKQWVKHHAKSQSFKDIPNQLSSLIKPKSIVELLGSARQDLKTPAHLQHVASAGEKRRKVFKRAALKSAVIDLSFEEETNAKHGSLKNIA